MPGTHVPFCVGKRAYVVWSNDIERDNLDFLERIDAQFYYRTVTELYIDPDNENGGLSEDDEERKRAAPLARLLWHHGAETLVMLLGAYIQAPLAVNAYFIKCKNEDAIAIARAVLSRELPKYNRLNEAPFSVSTLVGGIHLHVNWDSKSTTLERFSRTLRIFFTISLTKSTGGNITASNMVCVRLMGA